MKSGRERAGVATGKSLIDLPPSACPLRRRQGQVYGAAVRSATTFAQGSAPQSFVPDAWDLPATKVAG